MKSAKSKKMKSWTEEDGWPERLDKKGRDIPVGQVWTPKGGIAGEKWEDTLKRLKNRYKDGNQITKETNE